MGNVEFWKTMLGSGALTLILIAAMNAGLKLYENRKQKLHAAQDAKTQQEHFEAMRDADWNAMFRHAAERHLPWDHLMLSTVRQHEDAINDLREDSGKPRIDFPQIPPPPPLFPEPRRGDD